MISHPSQLGRRRLKKKISPKIKKKICLFLPYKKLSVTVDMRPGHRSNNYKKFKDRSKKKKKKKKKAFIKIKYFGLCLCRTRFLAGITTTVHKNVEKSRL